MEHKGNPQPHPHQRLFARFCSDSKQAVEEVYHIGYSSIERMVLKNSGTQQDAEDIFQEALIVLLDKCDKKFILSSSIGAFIYGVCRNQWKRNLKNNKRLPITFTDISEYNSIKHAIQVDEEDSIAAEKFRQLWAAITKLSKNGQQLIRLYYLEGKSLDEIAKEMGYSGRNSAKVQKSKYMKQLRDLTKEED